jgi:predicted O-methyltransferase YrrM
MKPDIESKLIIPGGNKAIPVREIEAEFIYYLIKEKNLKKTLEIGFGYGRSAAYIMRATNARHIVVDPFQENYESLGLKNIQNLGLEKNLVFERDFSHNVLPRLHANKETFDFVFIDGNHQFDGVFVDFYYADLLLDRGGYVLFHDTWMRGIQLTASFIKKDRKDYQYVKTPLRNLALFQKIDQDTRYWFHFKEFYTFRSLVSHHLISCLNQDGGGFFKSLLMKLKQGFKSKS